MASFPEIYINLSLPQYIDLKTDGGYVYYKDGGLRGLIIVRKDATTYLVFERTCTYKPNDACATVNVDDFGFMMEDPCCQSTFDISDGQPTHGPAVFALRQYKSHLEGNDLYITDQVVY